MYNSLGNFHNLNMRFNVQRFAEFQRGYSSNLMTLKLNYFIDFFFCLLLEILLIQLWGLNIFIRCNTGFDNTQTNSMKWSNL